MTTVRAIDEIEGVPQLLSILATKTRAKRGDLLPEWRDYLHAFSNLNSESVMKMALRTRLVNMVEREFVSREGQSLYVITRTGIGYAAADPIMDGVDPKYEVLQAITSYNQKQRQMLREQLESMEPYRFEYLIGELLDAMGYEDVQVTKASGDKGVDVIGTLRFGFTTIREYVQAKRYQGSIQRPTLDQLRGALPYHHALRGTIISTGTFSKGCKEAASFQGAAPISLIDGEQLLDLLLEHKLGVTERKAVLYELDDAFFAAPMDPTDVDAPFNELDDL